MHMLPMFIGCLPTYPERLVDTQNRPVTARMPLVCSVMAVFAHVILVCNNVDMGLVDVFNGDG